MTRALTPTLRDRSAINVVPTDAPSFEDDFFMCEPLRRFIDDRSDKFFTRTPWP